MGLILCIETATTNCSVALGQNGELLALKEDYSDSYSHSERLHVYIQELLNQSNITAQDLDAVAVSRGPGSYTGLRIGVSAAKGLCFSLDRPLIAIPTLASLAAQVSSGKEGTIIPMLDARRMEVYTAGFTASGESVFDTRAEILDPESYSEHLEKGPVYFIGNGVSKFREICTHSNAHFIHGKLPSAQEMISLADARYKESLFEDVAYFEPYYLKNFIAG